MLGLKVILVYYFRILEKSEGQVLDIQIVNCYTEFISGAAFVFVVNLGLTGSG